MHNNFFHVHIITLVLIFIALVSFVYISFNIHSFGFLCIYGFHLISIFIIFSSVECNTVKMYVLYSQAPCVTHTQKHVHMVHIYSYLVIIHKLLLYDGNMLFKLAQVVKEL